MTTPNDADRDFGSSDCSSSRGQFESWISSDPYSESVARYPNDPTKYGWPGSYKDIRVDMCWMAWKEAWEQSKEQREFLDAILNTPFCFWTCPVCDQPRVQWIGGVATCVECRRTNKDVI